MIYVLAWALTVLVITFILAIVAIVKVEKLEKDLNGIVKEVQDCFDEVADVLNISADIADVTREALTKLRENDETIADALEDIDYDFTCLREDVDNLDADVVDFYKEFFCSKPEESEEERHAAEYEAKWGTPYVPIKYWINDCYIKENNKCDKKCKKPGRPKSKK